MLSNFLWKSLQKVEYQNLFEKQTIYENKSKYLKKNLKKLIFQNYYRKFAKLLLLIIYHMILYFQTIMDFFKSFYEAFD